MIRRRTTIRRRSDKTKGEGADDLFVIFLTKEEWMNIDSVLSRADDMWLTRDEVNAVYKLSTQLEKISND